MASPLLACLLALSTTYTSALPLEAVVDQLQAFLTAPEQSGLRLRRSTDGVWDKELDLASSLGVVFQIKYNNRSNPLEGGRAHVQFPGRRFISNAPFDDVDLDITFNGGSAVDGLFHMMVDYKFVQKFTFLADRPHEGTFIMYRALEGGQWKSRMNLVEGNKELLNVSLESDRQTMFHAIFNYEDDNKWEVKASRVEGKSISLDLVLNGHKYTGLASVDIAAKKINLRFICEDHSYNLDFDLNPAGNWGIQVTGDVDGPVDAKLTMQPDFKQGEMVIKYKDQSYAFVTLKGQAEMAGVLPQLFDYVVKYSIIGEDQGKAKLKYDGKAANKQFQMSHAPKEGSAWDYVFQFDLSNGFKYLSDLKVNGAEVEKAEGDYTWTNDATKFELATKDSMVQTKENPFYGFNKLYTSGIEMFHTEKTRTIFFDKLLLNRMKVEEKVVFDGKTWYAFKYDSTSPKVTAFLTYLTGDQMNTYSCNTEYLANNGVKADFEIRHGEVSTHKGEYEFDVKANNADIFEMDVTEKVVMTEDSPFYGMMRLYAGRYGKNMDSKVHIFFDKKAKSLAFVPKMKYTALLEVDGKKVREVKLDNTKARRSLKMFWEPNAFTQSYNFVQSWELHSETFALNMDYKRGDISVFNYDFKLGWLNNAAKFEVNLGEKVTMSEESAFYSWGKFMHGQYWKKAVRTVKVFYDKQNRNALFGKMLFNDIISLDDQRYRKVKVDTQTTPYSLVWYQPSSGHLLPSAQQVTGQKEVTVTVNHTPGQELKVETNLEKLQSIRVSTEGNTRNLEINGQVLTSFDFDGAAKKASNTMKLPNGEQLTVSLAWPKVTADASDLEFSIMISPNRKMDGKLGWASIGGHANNKVYLDVKGSNPWMGDYKISRKGELKVVSRIPMYNLKWTGHDEAGKGPLAAFSPIETDMKVSINANTVKVDANMFKMFGGKKWGLILQNDRFELVSGRS